jgi:hypothetical protein
LPPCKQPKPDVTEKHKLELMKLMLESDSDTLPIIQRYICFNGNLILNLKKWKEAGSAEEN